MRDACSAIRAEEKAEQGEGPDRPILPQNCYEKVLQT